MKKYVYIDLETIPDGNIEDFELTKEVPKNYKDPEKIKQWQDEQREEQFLRQSLDTNRAKILTIGAATDQEQPQCFIDLVEYDEKIILQEFENYLQSQISELIKEGVGEERYMFHDIVFVGHNIKKFDLQILFVKSVKYKMPLLGSLVHPARQRYNNGKSYDTMEIWGGADAYNFVSLDTIAKAMDIQGKKSGMDGSQVYPKFKEGKVDEIISYQRDDVELVRNVFLNLKNIIGV